MQADLFRAPPPPRPPEVLIVGTPEDCRAKTRELWADEKMRLVRYLCPGDRVPPRLVAIWATPREKLPAEFGRALEGARVKEWRP